MRHVRVVVGLRAVRGSLWAALAATPVSPAPIHQVVATHVKHPRRSDRPGCARESRAIGTRPPRTIRTAIVSLVAEVLLCANPGSACATPAAVSESFPTTLIVTGQISCGEFIEDQRGNNPALMDLFAFWVWRFLVSHREFLDVKPGHAGGAVDLPDRATVLSFLGRFCAENPMSDVHNGSVALLKSRRRGGLESTQAVIVGRLRVRKTRAPARKAACS